jgi:hypothetical protein
LFASDGGGCAETRRRVEAALQAAFIGAERIFVDADGQDAVTESSSRECRVRIEPTPGGIGRETAAGGEEAAVPVDGVNIADVRKEQGPAGVDTRSGRDDEMLPVPRVANAGAMALRAPRRVGGDLLPAVVAGGVVDAGRGEGGIVAEMKLPRAIEGNGPFAEVLNRECRRGGLRGCELGEEGEDQRENPARELITQGQPPDQRR